MQLKILESLLIFTNYLESIKLAITKTTEAKRDIITKKSLESCNKNLRII